MYKRMEENLKKFKLNKSQIWSGSVLLAIIIALAVLYFAGRAKGWFDIFESVEDLQEYVSGFGTGAPLMFFLLQVLLIIEASLGLQLQD